MKQPSVYIVTPAHNAAAHTGPFLQSVRGQSYQNIKVIIIDDGSSDGTGDLISNQFPDATVLKGDGDLWWSGATNKGVKYAINHDADYILTVNIDVVLDKACVKNLVEAGARNPDTLIGSVILDIKHKTKVWYYGGYIDQRAGDFRHASGTIKDVGEQLIKPEWLTGMGVLIPSKVFADVGYYDNKNFPHYFGDSDFSLRAKRQGFELAVEPKAIVYADLSSSWLERWLAKPSPLFFWRLFTSRRSQYNIKIRTAFYRRYWGPGYIRALLKLYFVSLFSLYRLWAVLFIKRMLGKK
jgi:GT2 family glycosyltransferase